MLHPTTWHSDAYRTRIHSEVLDQQLNQYAHTHIRPHVAATTNLDYVPPSLLQPRAYAGDAANDRILGGGSRDHIAPVRRILTASAMPLGSPATGLPETFAPPTQQQLRDIQRYGQCPELPYNSADFPPRIGTSDLKRGRRFSGFEAHPLQWNPALDQTSSKQFRSKQEEGVHFHSHLHPPMASTSGGRSRRTAGSTGSTESAGTFTFSTSTLASTIAPYPRQPVSTKRYHRPLKPSLPELNKATYVNYMAKTQPLLSANLAGRKRCPMSVWRDELVALHIHPHAQNPHAERATMTKTTRAHAQR